MALGPLAQRSHTNLFQDSLNVGTGPRRSRVAERRRGVLAAGGGGGPRGVVVGRAARALGGRGSLGQALEAHRFLFLGKLWRWSHIALLSHSSLQRGTTIITGGGMTLGETRGESHHCGGCRGHTRGRQGEKVSEGINATNSLFMRRFRGCRAGAGSGPDRPLIRLPGRRSHSGQLFAGLAQLFKSSAQFSTQS